MLFVCPPPCGRAEADPDAFVEHFKEADHVEIDNPMLDAFVDSEELSKELHDNFDIRLRNGYTTLLHEDVLKPFDPASRETPALRDFPANISAQELKAKEEAILRRFDEIVENSSERLKEPSGLPAFLLKVKSQELAGAFDKPEPENHDCCWSCFQNNSRHPEHPQKK